MIYCIERFPKNDIWIVFTMKYDHAELLKVESWFDVDYGERGYEVHVVAHDPATALYHGVQFINDHIHNQWRKDFGQL